MSSDGKDLGEATTLPSIATPPSSSAPQPSRAMSASAAVGADSFVISGIQQDKPGFSYVLVTELKDQATQV